MYTGQYDWTSFQHCHKGPIHVMNIGTTSIWAGSRSEVTRGEWALRIRISDTGAVGEATDVHMDYQASKMLPRELLELDIPPTLDIMWPDFGTPELGWQWWDRLVEALRALPKGSDVGIHCMGGHGRTGTALAILAALSEQTDGDPVQWVRDRYCEEAVESAGQIGYVEEVTGIPVRAASAYANKQSKTPVTKAGANHMETLGYVWNEKRRVYEPADNSGDSYLSYDENANVVMESWKKLSNGEWKKLTDEQYDAAEARLKEGKDPFPIASVPAVT